MRPIFARAMYPGEVRRLYKLVREGKKQISKRAKAIVLSGIYRYKVSEISRMLDFHPNHLRKWIHRFNHEGIESIIDAPEIGIRRKFDESIKGKIAKIVKKPPRKYGLSFSDWTLYRLKYYLEESGIVDKISHETVRRILKEHKIDLKTK
ncbi:MAG: helix-turn-helix domain-containing protein [bacterium]|nr:helix-turn-helix domain-containing protein [bacterium]